MLNAARTRRYLVNYDALARAGSAHTHHFRLGKSSIGANRHKQVYTYVNIQNKNKFNWKCTIYCLRMSHSGPGGSSLEDQGRPHRLLQEVLQVDPNEDQPFPAVEY